MILILKNYLSFLGDKCKLQIFKDIKILEIHFEMIIKKMHNPI